MVISNMQRLLDALQKWWPVHEGLPIFMRGVAAAMVLLLVTPTSLEATADRSKELKFPPLSAGVPV